MAVKLLMPKIGLNMVEGQINEWLVAEGQAVKKGEILYVVETDKVTNDIESPQDGIIAKILVSVGEIVSVREVVGVLVAKGEDIDLTEFLKEETAKNDKVSPTPEEKAHRTSSTKMETKRSGSILASPLAKRLARDNHIDLEKINGTGPGGRIKTEDVEAVIKEKIGTNKDTLSGKIVPANGVRKVIAERLSRANAEIPMVTLHSTIDVTSLVAYRKHLKAGGKEKAEIPGYNAILAFLTARVLKNFPYMNASWLEKGIKLIDPVNIGIAVDTEDGLRVVVLHDAEKKSLEELNELLKTLVDKAVVGKNSPDELSGGTFTITNLGMFGVDSFTPLINPPEAGILGVGRFREENGRYLATFSLVFDHRIIDGAPAARFLQRFGELIEDFK